MEAAYGTGEFEILTSLGRTSMAEVHDTGWGPSYLSLSLPPPVLKSLETCEKEPSSTTF